MGDQEKAALLGDKTPHQNGGRQGSYSYEALSGQVPKIVVQANGTRKMKRHLSFAENMDKITLTWNNVDVYVPPPSRSCCRGPEPGAVPKQILNNVSGIVKPGTLVAMIGASGAGKSTLLNVLTYRNRGNLEVTGDVRVNGENIGRGISAISAYIQQDDLFVGTLTVREHLIFTARLRMAKGVPYSDRILRVNQVIQELGLDKCANTVIGIPGRLKGISGGEMKRLAFASEVITNPPLLFCDEPTSGLDSFMAENVVHTLKKMSEKGMSIISTIHQPSSEVFALFDRILLMGEGRVAYLGPTKGAFSFFESLNMPCPSNFNPADHYIHAMAIRPGQEDECRAKVTKICDAYDKSDFATDVLQSIEFSSTDDEMGRLDILDNVHRSPYRANWCQQFVAVLWRSWLSSWRDPMAMKVRVAQTVFIAVLLGLIYLQQTYNQAGVMNINGLIFLFLTNLTFTNLFAVVNSFPAEIPIFRREHFNGMYRTDVYFLCKNLAELPSFIITPIMFCAIVYWMVGMYNSLEAFLVACGVVVLVANNAVSFGYMISTASKSVTMALALGPPFLIPLMLFGGFFLNTGSLPPYLIWIKYLSWFQFSNEILSVNQWQHVDNLICETSPNSTGLFFASSADPSCNTRCFRNGAQVLASFGFSKDNVLLDLGLLAGLMVGYRILSFIFLLIRSSIKE